MNKLLLMLVIIMNTTLLHGMESNLPLRETCYGVMMSRRSETKTEEKPSPITLSQTYHHFSEVLPREITQYIFSLQLKASNINLAKLSLKMKQSCEERHKFVGFVRTLISSCGYNLALELFKYFLPHEKSICDIKDQYNWTAFHHAAFFGYRKITKFFLDSAGNDAWTLLTMKGTNSLIALHHAAKNGNIKIVKLLLDTAGNNLWTLLTITDTYGRTALHFAAEEGHVKVVEMLLKAADDKVQDYMAIKTPGYCGSTAFDRAIKEVPKVMKSYLQNSSCLAFCAGCCLF